MRILRIDEHYGGKINDNGKSMDKIQPRNNFSNSQLYEL
jgi:hypothetical protein